MNDKIELAPEVIALPKSLREIAKAILESGELSLRVTDMAHFLIHPDNDRKSPLNDGFNTLRRTLGPRHKLVGLVRECVAVLGPVVTGSKKETPATYRERLNSLASSLDEAIGTKPRRSTRRCKSRDEQFAKWSNDGLSAKEIAAKWNRLHSDDTVSDEVVKKGIQRSRDK